MSEYLLIFTGRDRMKKSEETKQKILDTTIEMISKKGYAPTTTKEIAEMAGVSEGTIFKYYGSKKDLLREIVDKTIREFKEYSVNEAIPEVFARVEDKSPRKLLYLLMAERAQFFSDHSASMQVIIQETMIDESIRETFKGEVWSEMTRVSDKIFDRAKELGQFKKEFDNETLRRVIFGSFFFYVIFEGMLDVNNRDDENPTEVIELTLDLILSGILTDDSIS
ncbi:TetR/AcrR family transcriptional regulator [Candidatus Bipolaricaulota bacterium]|nr:TetR/AcrR family transcriptional regulator [Candidatus Bipolaricaulota bacterium]